MRTTNSLMQLAHDTADWQAMTSSILFSLSQALAQAPPDLDEIALIIARQFADVWGFPEVSIALYNPQNNTFRYLIDYYDTENVDPSIEDWTGKVVSMSDSPATAQVMETLEPLIVHASNPSTNPAQAKLMEEYDVKTAAFFPLSVKGRFIGRIELETWGEEYPFTPQEINLAIAMASQAAVALENAQLYKTAKYEISERAQAKKALQESQALYHSLVENLPQNIFRKDIDGHITFVNQHYCTTLGKTLEEILGKTDFELYPPELAEKYRKEDLRVIKTQQVFETVSETKLPDKTTTYAQVIKSPLYDSEGNVSGIQGVFWDVTEQIRIDTSRRTAEQRYRSLFQQAHDAVFIADLNGNHKEVNQRAAEMLGYTIEELKQLSFIDVSVETDDSKQVIENLLAGQHLPQYERLFRKKDGAIIPVEITVELVRDADGKPLHIQSVVRDITERKQSELEREALVNALEHRSMLLETAASVSKSVTAILSPDKLLQETVDLIQSRFSYYYVGIFLVNEEKDFAILKAGTGKAGKQMLASEHKLAVGGESMIGWSVAHAKAKIAHDVGEEAVHFENPHLPETRSEMALPLVIHGEAIGAFTVQSIKETAFSEEDITVLQAMADQLAIAIQNARSYDTAQREIVERAQAEEELRNLRNYLANIIDSMPSILVGVNTEGVVTQWNYQAQQVTGIHSREAVGQPLGKAFPRLAAEMERVIQSMQTREVLSDPRQIRRKDGETYYEDITIYPLIANGVEGAVIRIDDVTEQVRLQEMMIQSEKMLSVGGLAAGMAHEINNPLAGIMQTASVVADRLTRNLPANERAAAEVGTSMEVIQAFMHARGIPKMLDRIQESGNRAAKIVTNMLSFARKSDAILSSYSLAELLDQSIDLASSDYDLKKQYDFKQIEIIRKYEKDLPLVPCEKSKIQQVFLNILRNGAEAMQEMKGEGKVENPKFILTLTLEEETEMLRVEIEDNGPGMDEATRNRVFEPFFTTKPVGEGTGLGLSVSYFIITETHNGKMNVESTPGAGAKFIILLPTKRSSKT